MLVYCSSYKMWNLPYWGFGSDKLYCYDNMFADSNLHNGDGEAKGVYKWFDVYTWSGWLDVYVLIMFFTLFKTIVKDLFYLIFFVGLYLANDDMVWCFPGEKIPFFFMNLCEIAGY